MKKVDLKITLPVLGAEQIKKAVYFYIFDNSNNTTFESLFIQTDSKIIEYKKNGKPKGEILFPYKSVEESIMVPIKLITG